MQDEYVIDTIDTIIQICKDITQTSGNVRETGVLNTYCALQISDRNVGRAAITYFLCDKQAILSPTALLGFRRQQNTSAIAMILKR